MRMFQAIVVLAVVFVTMIGQAGDSAPFSVDTMTPSMSPAVDSLSVLWDVAWIGGDTNATVVISDNGTEVRYVTGTDEFVYTLPSIGRHELTYTTYIGGMVQSEVYSVTVYAKWKYEVVNGGVVITETTQTSGEVTIPSEIDGYPVVGVSDTVFAGCVALETIDIPESVVRIGANVFETCSALETVITNGLVLYQGWCLGWADTEVGHPNLVIPVGVRGIAAGAFEQAFLLLRSLYQ